MKSITCPNCNGTNIAEIMWGLPSGKFMEEYNKEKNKGKYRLGGCCISNDDPALNVMIVDMNLVEEKMKIRVEYSVNIDLQMLC